MWPPARREGGVLKLEVGMRNVEGGLRPLRAVGSLYDKPKGHTPTPRREGGIKRVEHRKKDYHEGYEVEFFAGNGETIAVVSVPATAPRAATRQGVLHVRQLCAV